MQMLQRVGFFLTVLFLAVGVRATTYLPVSDAELARKSALIVRGRVLGRVIRLENIGGEALPFTITTVEVLEVLKGGLAGPTIEIRLPGGKVGDLAWGIPGTPTFQANQEVVILVNPATGHAGEYHLSEFGLSSFNLVSDKSGHRFAMRPAFDAEEDLYLALRTGVATERSPGRPTQLRDADSFLAALRASASNHEMPDIQYAAPQGTISYLPAVGVRPEWANIGGREPGDCSGRPCLFRWFWDTSVSPAGVIVVSGTQSNLSDGSNGLTHVQNGVTKWAGVFGVDVRYSGPAGSGNVNVFLDAASSFDGGAAWTTPLPCGQGGVIGVGGPNSSSGPYIFKGEGSYFALPGAKISMRPHSGAAGCYSAAVFRSAILHEMGHTLGLGHPDQDQSIHSTTNSTDWLNAVMVSVISSARPDTPQADDIQAIQYYYGTGSIGQAPTPGFSYSPTSPLVGQSVSFSDTSGGSPTSWFWNFGDGGTAVSQNPTHSFAFVGTVGVTLSASNSHGVNQLTKPVTVVVAPTCPASVLCLANDRFRITASWRTANSNGTGTAVQVLSDSGYFWFFGPSAIEVVLKVVNGCAFNNRHWVFAGGLTNVNVILTVTDTVTGAVKTYSNPQNVAFQPIQDTAAFATCP